MTFFWRVLIVLALVPFLVASAHDSEARSRKLRDAKPHNGVAAAHTMPVQGIDVSYWQGDIDWNVAREAGVHFAFIKATEGGDHLDPKFLDN